MTGRSEDGFTLSRDEIETFQRDGFVVLREVFTGAELDELSVTYERFLSRDIPVPGKDFCDMSGHYGGDPTRFSVINIMLPSRYHAPWRDNVAERRARSIARQLHGDDMVLDYDQLLAKPPGSEGGAFAWHQDQAYWPKTPDTRTATMWLAIDPSGPDNGGMHFLPGSNRARTVRPHAPLSDDRAESHALVTEVGDDEAVLQPDLQRGDVTIHDEYVVHGSPGNPASRWRRGYVLAFRSEATVKEERRLGFTHSHEDAPEVLDSVEGLEG